MLDYKIEHFGISVNNLEETAKWYKENFGFKEDKRIDRPNLELTGILMKLGDASFEILSPYSGIKQIKSNRAWEDSLLQKLENGESHLALNVNDVELAYNQLRQNNVEFVTEIQKSRHFFCKDLNGFLIEIRQRK